MNEDNKQELQNILISIKEGEKDETSNEVWW